MKKEEVYVGALLHDIGKVIERSKIYSNSEVNRIYPDIKYSHARFSAFFLEKYIKNPEWVGYNKNNIIDIGLFHHQPLNIYHKIVQLADWLASSERSPDEENDEYYNKVLLKSIFSNLSEYDEEYYYDLKKLNFDNFIPQTDPDKDSNPYRKIVNELKNDFNIEKIKDKEDILFLIEKYLSFVPAQTTKFEPDISLFDHSRITAAIAVCLYAHVEEGLLKEDQLDILLNDILLNDVKKDIEVEQEKLFVLIHGDLSGIQNYIFNIPSKGAAKSLKGRSAYLVTLMEIVSYYIIDELNLEKANIIYNGGGNFYILAPSIYEEEIKRIRKNIGRNFYKAHKEKLSCNISYTHVGIHEFKDFSKAWQRVSRESASIKENKFSEIWEDEYNSFFEGRELIEGDLYCHICHSSSDLKNEDDKYFCYTCKNHIKLTEKIKDAKYFVLSKVNSGRENAVDLIEMFGYEFEFINRLDQVNKNQKVYVLNNFNDEKTIKWKTGSLNLPENHDFETIAKNKRENEAINEKNEALKLAYLKLDVDNLGRLFIQGLKKKTLSRMSVLSRMMRFYFEGYLQNLILKNNWFDSIYIIFAGGDDTFLVGNINTVLAFIREFRENFSKFTANNDKITFSAAIGIFGSKFPVIKAADITEERLDEAKTFIYNKESEATKDKINLFGEIFSWEEFNYVLKIKDIIIEILNEKEKNMQKNRAVIQKIINSTKGFKPILEKASGGRIQTQKVWRLRYYLRNLGDKKESIIKIYEDMWLKNLFQGKQIKNHQIITVAARLAELETREG